MPPKLTTQEFIDRARATHGDKYGYSFSVYQGNHTKLMIHCPEHGMFEQRPNNHMNGQNIHQNKGMNIYDTIKTQSSRTNASKIY